MAKKRFLMGALIIALVFGMMVVGCEEKAPEKDNAISSVSIRLSSSNNPPKVGRVLSASVENKDGYSVSGVTYQWKSSDSQTGTFADISNATSNSYTPGTGDANKYILVEAKNDDTPSPVRSNVVGPVDANQVAKPTAVPDGGEVVSGQEITLTSTTESAVIYYTLDGTTPTSASNLYSTIKPKITSSSTLKAVATKTDMNDSEVLSVSYTVTAAPTFTAVNSGSIFSSSGIYSAAYGSNKYVVGGNGKIAYSSDGTSWTSATVDISSFLIESIVYGGQKFVAVTLLGGILYSSDGTSWTSVTDSTFGTSTIYDVAFGGGKYVAVGDSGKMAYSENGVTWNAVADSTFGTSNINGITYGAGKFVAVGADGKAAYSDNGTAWTAVTAGYSGISGITYGGPSGKEKFIAVGGSYIRYSTDGITWAGAASDYYAFGLLDGLNRVAWGGNKYIAVATKGVMLYSLDGTYWAKIDGGTGTGKSQFDSAGSYSRIRDIVYGGGRFLAVGSKSDNITSATGEMAISNQ